MSTNPGQEGPFPHGGEGPDEEVRKSIYPEQASEGPVSAPQAPRREGAVPDVGDPPLMARLRRAAESMPRAGDVFAGVQLLSELGIGVKAVDPEGFYLGKIGAAYAALQLSVEEALERFSPQQRLMIELRIQGHRMAEIARQTGRSKRSVERALQEVRAGLRALLEEGGHDSAAQS